MKKLLFLFSILLLAVYGEAQCLGALTGTFTLSGTGQICPGAVVSNITVSPASTVAADSAVVAYTATTVSSDGTLADITSTAAWASLSPSIASISSSGVATCGASANGNTLITASSGGLVGVASLTCQPIPVITTLVTAVGTVGTAYSTSFSAMGGTLPYSWAVISGSLPDGLTLNNTSPTATITGTPTATGITSFRLQVTEHSNFTGFRDFSINIEPANVQAPTLPQRFVDGRESLLGSYTNTAIIDNASTWSCHGSSKGPYAVTLAGLNLSIADAEACRAANGDSTRIKIPHGTLISTVFTTGSQYVNLKQTGGDASTSPIIITSDAPLPTNDPLTTLARDQRVGTYNIASTSGLVRASGLVTVTGMNPWAAVPPVGDLATIWNPDDKTFAGQYTVCGAPTCSNPTATAFQYQQPEDLLLWMSSSAANRTANHQTGSGNPHYSYMDADGQKFWLIKGSSGHPWDINTYDGRYIYHYITEDGDSASQAACQAAGFSSCFVDQSAYKRHFNPVPIMPRFLAQGQTFTVDTPTTLTSVARTTNCELAGTTDTVSIGPVRGVAFFTTVAWGGTIGTVTTLENDFLYGISGGIYQNKEILQYVKGLGLIQWQNTHWNGSSYAVVQTTTDTTNTAGGAPTPVFPCSSNLVTNGTWIGGTPGVGGNSALPTPIVDATSQNGVINSLQAQNQITNMVASGCTTTGVIGAACLVTVDFLSNPNFSVNDRFEIIGSTCVGCITLDQNAFNTTWYVASVAADGNCSTCQITFNSYTEYLGNGATATNGTALHFNHILQDQVNCCMFTLENTSNGDMISGDTNQYHNYLIRNAELRESFGNTHGIGRVVNFGPSGFGQTPIPPMSVAGCNGSPAQTNCDEPVHVGIDASYIHAYSFPTVARTVDAITVGVQLDCGWCYVTNSYLQDIHVDGSESHGIHVHSGVGPFKIVDNSIEGTSENIFSSYNPQIDGLPNGWYCDWEIRRNWLTTNQFEMMNSGGAIPNGTGKYFQYLQKNKTEFKNVCNAVIDGNIFEYSSGGNGEQSGQLAGNNETPNNATTNATRIGAQSHDVTWSNNLFRHGFEGVYFPTRSGGNDSMTFGTNHYAWINNIWYDIGNITLYGRNGWISPNWTMAFSALLQIANRGQLYQTTTTNFDVTPNTVATIGNCSATSATSGGVTTATMSCGKPNTSCSIRGGLTSCTSTCVPIIGGGTCGVGFQAGEWVAVSGCSDTNYNVVAPMQVPSLTSDPTLTNPVFQYNVPSAAGATATGCAVGNAYGHTRNTTFAHNLIVQDYNFTSPVYSNKYPKGLVVFAPENSNQGAQGDVMLRDWWIQNNVFSLQWPAGTAVNDFFYCAPNGKEGTLAEQVCWDKNSLVWTNNAIVGNTPSLYTEYNSPAGVAGANNGASPPVTDLMSLANGCATSTPDATCIGFAGNYRTNNCGLLGCGSPANVPDFAPLGFDYHQFALQAGSAFASGKAHQASDGTNLGPDFNALDNALGLQQYPGGNP